MSELVESRLSKKDMTPEGGCSAAFKNSLKSFLDNYVKAFIRTWDPCESTEGHAKMENSATTKNIVLQLSGATARQLEVSTAVFLMFYQIFSFFVPFSPFNFNGDIASLQCYWFTD